jgi:hypothetical protein
MDELPRFDILAAPRVAGLVAAALRVVRFHLQAEQSAAASVFAAALCSAHHRLAGGGVAGVANFASSTGAFGCTSLSCMVDCPSVQVKINLNGI